MLRTKYYRLGVTIDRMKLAWWEYLHHENWEILQIRAIVKHFPVTIMVIFFFWNQEMLTSLFPSYKRWTFRNSLVLVTYLCIYLIWAVSKFISHLDMSVSLYKPSSSGFLGIQLQHMLPFSSSPMHWSLGPEGHDNFTICTMNC